MGRAKRERRKGNEIENESRPSEQAMQWKDIENTDIRTKGYRVKRIFDLVDGPLKWVQPGALKMWTRICDG